MGRNVEFVLRSIGFMFGSWLSAAITHDWSYAAGATMTYFFMFAFAWYRDEVDG